MHNPLSNFLFCPFFGQKQGVEDTSCACDLFLLSSKSFLQFLLLLLQLLNLLGHDLIHIKVSHLLHSTHSHSQFDMSQNTTQSLQHVTKYHTVTFTSQNATQSISQLSWNATVSFLTTKCHVSEQAAQRNDCKTQELLKCEFPCKVPFFSNKMFRTTGETEGLLLMYSNSYHNTQKPWMFCFRTKTV